MTHFAIGGIQMPITIHDNLDAIAQRIDLMMHLYPWVEMVLLSELAAHGPNQLSAEPVDGRIEETFQNIARKHDIWLIPGSYFEQGEHGAIHNTAPVINPAGEIVTRYRKMFPFTPYEENVTPGTEFCVFDVPEVGRFGLSICYDIWFPEVTRTLTSMGAEVILNPVLASFVDRYADISIAQASGAMFQSYIFHINGLAAGGNGYSLVVDPAGRVIHKGNVADELIPLEIDFGLVRRQRERGLLNMGHPLKSFRDAPVAFDVYSRDFDHSYLASLGPLEKSRRPR